MERIFSKKGQERKVGNQRWNSFLAHPMLVIVHKNSKAAVSEIRIIFIYNINTKYKFNFDIPSNNKCDIGTQLELFFHKL